MYDITTFGETLIDFTPFGTSESGHALYEENPGGAPANVAVASQKLGQKVAFIGKVGDDFHGKLLKETLENDGVDTIGVVQDPNCYTTLAFVTLNKGERSFSFARKPGADTMITKEEVRTEILENTGIFHCGSLSLTDEPARSTTLFALKHAKESGALISYDPNYRELLWNNEEVAMEQMRSLIPYVDIMKISDEETKLLTDKEDPDEAAEELIKQGVSCVVVTLGKDGALMKTNSFTVREKGKERKVVDTTGAGDAFWGGILACFSKDNIKLDELTKEQGSEFLQFANTAAGLCIEKRGAIPALPTLGEVVKESADFTR